MKKFLMIVFFSLVFVGNAQALTQQEIEKKTAIEIYNNENAKENEIASAIIIFDKYAHEDDEMLYYLGKANYDQKTNLVSTNRKEGEIFIEKAAVRGNALAEYEYAMILIDKRKVSKSLPFLKSAAKKNNSDAQYTLGKMLYLGKGIKKNKSQGFNLITSAANLQNADAQYDLARIYFAQKDQKIQKTGVKWLEESVKNKKYEACDELYKLYLTGILVPMDDRKHLNYLNCSATNDNEDAMLLLATYYAKGKFLSRDPHKSAYWFRLLAQKGNAEASLHYANYVFTFKKKSKTKLSEAISFLENTYMKDAEIAKTLGYIYKNGSYGKNKEKIKALKYFETAKELGDAQVQNEILKLLNTQN